MASLQPLARRIRAIGREAGLPHRAEEEQIIQYDAFVAEPLGIPDRNGQKALE